jgi:hypothetical protein
MAKIRQPARAKERADEIADLISAAGEKLVALSNEWFELNDEEGLRHARQMLDAKEVSLMLSVHLEPSGLGHIALNLLRTETPMPRPYFEVRVPMLPWSLNSMSLALGGSIAEGFERLMTERRGREPF